ncbi:MAG: M3 family oligoendopeptidase [Clostridia bacterium]|nr:M3 family oligoendopeptidase [Clostridia bacterium]
MKVSEMPYKRITVEEFKEQAEKIIEKIKAAKSAENLKAARDEYNAISVEVETACALANCRFTLNTRDEFYNAEMDYYDNAMPLFSEIENEYKKAMLDSPYRAEAEKFINSRVFKGFEVSLKTFSPEVIEDLQAENALVTRYSKFMGELSFEFEGEKMPLSVLRGKLEDDSREIRRKAAEAIGKTMEENSETFDEIFDGLVKIRTQIARKLGYKNFVELGYYRMGRVDYDEKMVAAFRKSVETDIVPAVAQLKERIRNRLGLDKIMYYDDAISVTGEMPRPVIDTPEIFANALKMYNEMQCEIGDFMQRMLDADAFDVEARDGKFGGGYCTTFAKYKQPFILANFNGTSGDIDVITHEFGHALAADFMFKFGQPDYPIGMETHECHSMSMEFLCHKWMDDFFGESAEKYKYKHTVDAISFIPYGVIVDEFQHVVYENPELTPDERKAEYLKLEAKYRPYLSFEGIPYLELGTRWQYQMHIYESPFYYIDYCLAQCVALGFLCLSREDFDDALEKYVAFLKSTGGISLTQLIENAGLTSPFAHGALADTAAGASKVIKELDSKLS